jgi:hypothetical protein
MHAALRPYVTAGVALVGSSVIAVTPIAPSQPDIRAASTAVSLAADSIANIPANLLIALANVPYNFLTALGNGNVNLGSQPNSGFSFQPGTQGITLTQPAGNVVGLTANLNYAGNWWVYSPTNVLGTDPGDVSRYQALMNVLVPFPALSVPLGNILTTILASQLPMNAGCTGTGTGSCPNVGAILSTMFNLQHIVDLFSPGGYTFPAVQDPITCSATGQCDIANPNGPALPWSGQNVALDLSAPFTSFYNSLTATPDFSAIHTVTAQMVVDTFVNFAMALNTAFNPFVLGTQCGLCAPFVPNPGGLPVPGPLFPPNATTTTTTTTPGVATLAMETLAAPGGDVPQVADLGTTVDKVVGAGTATSNAAGALDTSLQQLQKKTVVPNPGQGLVTTADNATTEVDATPAADPPKADQTSGPTTGTTTDPSSDLKKDASTGEAKTSGPRHAQPDAVESVQNKINASISKITNGSTGGASATGSGSAGANTDQGGEANSGAKGGEAGSGKHSK